ncbi:PilZ domain-containing protein [Qipengyuania sp. JC766]|uniref:PilZ domain-containing protein n=1 Tax=Qipengyuania sp. JC766 TaxID=3232139 RepID=UPI003457F7C9
MAGVETRHIPRDSLFLMAEVRLRDAAEGAKVRVRNLSAGGMMAEGDLRVQRGAQLAVNLRNVGWVEGSVAWVQDDRFGIAFANEIDHKAPRAADRGEQFEPPRWTRNIKAFDKVGERSTGNIRKI